MLSLFVTFLLAAAPASPPASAAAIPAQVAAIFAPYARAGADGGAVWDRPIFSREVTALIAQWRAVTPQDEPDGLSDGDWLCLCQDWDATKFAARIRKTTRPAPGMVRLRVALDLGEGSRRDMVLALRLEDGAWKIDDIRARDFPQGLKQALRETIAEDRKLAGH